MSRGLWRDAFWFAAGLALVLGIVQGWPVGSDTAGFWHHLRAPDVYATGPYGGGTLGFFYAPPMALALRPLAQLPWPVFWAAWTAVALLALRYIGGRRAVLLLAFPPVLAELYAGNVHLVLAAVAVATLPEAWAFALLTKPTAGVGLLWYVVRREWRALARALGATAAIVVVSALLAPDLWREWIALLAANGSDHSALGFVTVPLVLRLPAAAALVTWGAATDRRWTVAVAMMLALPVLWLTSLAMLAVRPGPRRPQGPLRPVPLGSCSRASLPIRRRGLTPTVAPPEGLQWAPDWRRD